MKTTINVFTAFTAEERMTREGGEKLRKQILALWGAHQNPIVLEFQNKPVASVSFWDEGIAKLLEEGWSEADLGKRIQFMGLYPRDREIVYKLVKARASIN